jgi:hypothetical protein
MFIRPASALLSAIIVTAAWAGGAKAEGFTLESGERIEGAVIRSAGATISIKLASVGMRQLPIDAVREVELPLASGEALTGRLISWSRGVYALQVDDRLLTVRDGEILTEAAAAETENRDEPLAVAAVSPPDDGVGGPQVTLKSTAPPPLREADDAVDAAATPKVDDSEDSADGARAGDLAGRTNEETDAGAAADGPPLLVATVAPTAEDAGEMTFALDLSSAATKPIVVIFSAMDRTATAGDDYERQAGVLTIKAGEMGTTVKIPLLDDDQAEGDEEFELFLSVDPSVVRTDSARILATIEDDDS